MLINNILSIFVAFFISSCSADPDAQNRFITKFGNPNGNESNRWDGNPVLPIGSTQKIQWLTTNSSYNIILWQQLPNRVGAQHANVSIYTKTVNDVEQGEFNWTVTDYYFLLDFSSVFYIAFDPGTEIDQHALFNTNYFNITKAAATTSNSSSSSPTSDTPTSDSPSTPASPAPKKSDALKIGLGVGLGVGLSILLVGVILVALLLGRRRRAGTSDPPRYDQKTLMRELPDVPPAELPGRASKSELPNGVEAHELFGDQPQRPPADNPREDASRY